MDVNRIYCVNRFIIYTKIKLLCCTSKINVTLYVNYISVLKVENCYLYTTFYNLVPSSLGIGDLSN